MSHVADLYLDGIAAGKAVTVVTVTKSYVVEDADPDAKSNIAPGFPGTLAGLIDALDAARPALNVLAVYEK